MKKDTSNPRDHAYLRQRAEDLLKKSGIDLDVLCSKEELLQALQELSMQQIELEIQKEELKKSRDEIEKGQKRYAALYDFAPIGYLTLAPDSTILDANLTIERMLSCEQSHLKGVRFVNFIAKEDLPAFNSMLHRVFQTKTLEHCEIILGNIGFAEEPVSLPRMFRLDAIISDNPEECRLTLIDISDTLRAVEALKNNEAQYRSLFEAAQEGILILDYKSGKIVDANPYIAHLLGFSLDEIVGKELWEIGFILDKELARKAYLELQTKNYIRYSDLPLQHKSGQIIEVEFLSYVYAIGDEKAIQCNIRDISDQKKLEKSISNSHQETIHALASMLETQDPYTTGHQKRVAELSVSIAKELQFSPIEIEGMQLCSILHDIGKFNIPAELLCKSNPLTEHEKEQLRNHAQTGYDVIKGIHFPWPIAQTLLQHHERLDGSGYPNGLKGDSISKEAKIIAVADTVEAMTGARPYRSAFGIDMALKHIQRESGKLFDPLIVDACVKLFHEKKFNFTTRPPSETNLSHEGNEYGDTL
ncbi:MAG: PAS domain S-box protein [Chlorobium sp.]|nr:MAG: PAS domain S-box protein [Chlorobium sp.]